MKAADFIYHRASSVEDAVGHLAEHAGDARVLAGGQSLMPMLNMRLWRPSALIDINGIAALERVQPHGDETVVGATVRYVTLERSPLVAERLPLLARMVRFVGDRQVRNRGTLGGSLVQGDPTGEMPLGCLVLGARVRVAGPDGTREIPMTDFYSGPYAAALEPGELLTEVVFPKHPRHFAFREFCRRHNDFAVLSIAVTGDVSSDGRWRNVQLGFGGVNDTPLLVAGITALLEGSRLTDADIAAAGDAALDVIDPSSDIRASAEYRRHLAPIYVRRVLQDLRSSVQN